MRAAVPKPQHTTISKQLQWLKFRKAWLAKQPRDFAGYYLCNKCGIGILYPEVDHVIKRSIAPHRVFDETNLQVLCNPCHREKDQ